MISGGHYNAVKDAKFVLLRSLTIVGNRSHFGHFLFDFLLPLYIWLCTRGRLYDADLTVYFTDGGIEKFRKIIDDFFYPRVVTKFTSDQTVGIHRDILIGLEGHNRRQIGINLIDFIGAPKQFLEQMRKYVIEKMNLDVRDANNFVLVERKRVAEDRGGGRRYIENHEELKAAMSEFASRMGLKFTNAVLEDMSFKEQVEAFASAKVGVGQHGAGLCHLLWMPPGGVFHEVHYDDKQAYRFRQFCRFFGNVRHGHLTCPSGNIKTAQTSIRVPIEKLEASLREIMGAK